MFCVVTCDCCQCICNTFWNFKKFYNPPRWRLMSITTSKAACLSIHSSCFCGFVVARDGFFKPGRPRDLLKFANNSSSPRQSWRFARDLLEFGFKEPISGLLEHHKFTVFTLASLFQVHSSYGFRLAYEFNRISKKREDSCSLTGCSMNGICKTTFDRRFTHIK